MERLAWFRRHGGTSLLALATILIGVAIFSTLLVRRDTVEYYLDHQFSVHDAEFFPSAHALGDPLPIAGNKVELLHNGKRIFPTMLEAIRSAQESINFESLFSFIPGKSPHSFAMRSQNARGRACVCGFSLTA